MSRALNYSKFDITAKLAKQLKIETLTGGMDRKLYIYRVTDLKKYLANALGVAPITVKKDFSAAFAGKKGIVSFDVKGGATQAVILPCGMGRRFVSHHMMIIVFLRMTQKRH